MNVLLFTHEQDIDGIGCAILAHMAFSNLTIIPCKTLEINDQVEKTIQNKLIDSYDQIFVTDLCIKEPLLAKIAQDKDLAQKLLVLDHHKTELDSNKYSFVHVIVEHEQKKESGTSLFYEYLVQKKYLKRTPFLDKFVESTRRYDVWEWINYKDETGRNLHILFEQVGYQNYMKSIEAMIQHNPLDISFSKDDQVIIDTFLQTLHEELDRLSKELKIVELMIHGRKYKIGFVTTYYKYRNDLSEYIKKNNMNDIDLVGMIMIDKSPISFRAVKDVDVSVVASYFGGGGHVGAASCPRENAQFQKVREEYQI